MPREIIYSLRTIALAFEALTILSGGELKLRLGRYSDGLIFRHGDPKASWTASAKGRIEEHNPLALNEVVEDVAREGPTPERFLNSLKADGFNVSNDGTIVPLLATIVTPAREESVLEAHLTKLGWDLERPHLTQGITAYERGDWEAANAQFRTFLEAVFTKIANGLPGGSDKRGGEARKFLHQSGFLSDEEGKMIIGVFGFLNTRGSHPGLSEEFEARMRRYLVEVIALYSIEKLFNPVS